MAETRQLRTDLAREFGDLRVEARRVTSLLAVGSAVAGLYFK